jgi:formyl-CoA transferase
MSGVTVLDLTQIYNGPYATFLMAMAGAEIIKVEPPDGEFLRRRTARRGSGIPFAMLNANKRAVALNLKTERGRAVFLDLVRGVDVVAENFAPGVMERLGLGYDALAAVNPRLIYASGSGYGQTGPYRSLPAMDLTVQAMSGIMSITGFPDSPPVKSGPALCDFSGGVHMFGAIATALFDRERTGRGAFIDISMLETVYPMLASNIGSLYSNEGTVPERTGNRHGGLALCPYNVYPTSDGHLAIICNNDRHWERLLAAMGRDDLIGFEPYATMTERVRRMEDVDRLVGEWTRARRRADAYEALAAHRVPCAPVRGLDEVVADRCLHERGMLLDVDHPDFGPVTLCRSPLRFAGIEQPPYQVSPRCGADTADVLRERLGLSDADLAGLAADAAIPAGTGGRPQRAGMSGRADFFTGPDSADRVAASDRGRSPGDKKSFEAREEDQR